MRGHLFLQSGLWRLVKQTKIHHKNKHEENGGITNIRLKEGIPHDEQETMRYKIANEIT